MARRLTYSKRNPLGSEAAFPRAPKGTRSTERARAALSPFLGYVDPMADPRVAGYVVVERGRTVRVVGRPC